MLSFGAISVTPAAQAHGGHGHGWHHGHHHHHRSGQRKAYDHGYRRGYRRALKRAYRKGVPVYRPIIQPAHPVVIRPYPVVPHRSWLSLGIDFPL